MSSWRRRGRGKDGQEMPGRFRKKYWDQMPKYVSWTWERFFLLFAAACGVVSTFAFFTIDLWGQLRLREIILVSFFPVAVLALIIYIYVQSSKKLHRYAQTVYYSHFINHVIRDYLALLNSGNASQQDFKSAIDEILDSISQCFSILTGKRCRVSIKEIDNNQSLYTFARDRMTTKLFENRNKADHALHENTDFLDLWYGINGAYRYFICNNIPKLYLSGRYINSSFKEYGSPVSAKFIFRFVVSWPLPYKSTIVLPVRYIPDYESWPLGDSHDDEKLSHEDIPCSKRPDFWGFLCIDAKSKNIFDSTHAPELAAAFADALYILFSQSARVRDTCRRTDPARRDGQTVDQGV